MGDKVPGFMQQRVRRSSSAIRPQAHQITAVVKATSYVSTSSGGSQQEFLRVRMFPPKRGDHRDQPLRIVVE